MSTKKFPPYPKTPSGGKPKHIIDLASVEIMGYHEWMCGNGNNNLIAEAFDLGRRYERGTWPKKPKAKKCACKGRQCCDTCTGYAKAKADGTLRDKRKI